MLDDESDNYGYDSGSACTYAFSFRFEEYVGYVDDSVGRIHGMGSGVFVLTGIESNCGVVPLVVLVQIGVKSKGSRIIELF